MCRQFLCFVCDRPLTGDGSFLQCESNPDARPPWLEPWKPTKLCPRPIYLHSDFCHVPCDELRLQAQANIDQQLGIQAVSEWSDGVVHWQRSPDSTQSEQEMEIPQTRALLVSQHDHLEIPYDSSMIPQEIPVAHAQEQQPPSDPAHSHLMEEMVEAFGLYDQMVTTFDPQLGEDMAWQIDQQENEIFEGEEEGEGMEMEEMSGV